MKTVQLATLTLEPYPQIQRSKLTRPEPKRSSRDNSQTKTNRDDSKEKIMEQKINGLTLDQYLNKQQFQEEGVHEISQDEIQYLMDEFEINEVDEDFYTESMVESKKQSRYVQFYIQGGSKGSKGRVRSVMSKIFRKEQTNTMIVQIVMAIQIQMIMIVIQMIIS